VTPLTPSPHHSCYSHPSPTQQHQLATINNVAAHHLATPAPKATTANQQPKHGTHSNNGRPTNKMEFECRLSARQACRQAGATHHTPFQQPSSLENAAKPVLLSLLLLLTPHNLLVDTDDKLHQMDTGHANLPHGPLLHFCFD
jgi:hypothetical protein